MLASRIIKGVIMKFKVLAIDLGASSGRVMESVYNDGKISLNSVYRFSNSPVEINNSLYWNFAKLFQEIKYGIKMAFDENDEDTPIKSIGFDTWGVDYCYIDNNGDVLSLPHCYRDTRVDKFEDDFYKIISREELFKKTGVYPQKINSVLQIYSDLKSKPYLRESVDRVLFMPDLFNYLFSGIISNEYTISSTTGLMETESNKIDNELLELLGIPTKWFRDIDSPGRLLGEVKEEITSEICVEKFDVSSVCGHDTASAVLAIPSKDLSNSAFISSGTWSIVGIKTDKKYVNDEAFCAELTNEGCFDGSYRLLKNITGLWILQELQRNLSYKGNVVTFSEMVSLARTVEDNDIFINPNDAIFSTPGDMIEKIRLFLRETNQNDVSDLSHIIRIIIESLAFAYRDTIEEIEKVTKKSVDIIHMIGGGIQNELLCELTSKYSDKKVITGPIEASSIGNVLSQLIALGTIKEKDSLGIIKQSFDTREYCVKKEEFDDLKFKKYKKILG